MSLCNHNIINSSTFSWWGSYLNMNLDNIVICPKKSIYKERKNPDDYLSIIYPPDWIIINDY